MTPERIQDARELLDKLPPEEWVKRYGRDLITEVQRQAVGAVARGRIAAVAAGGAQLGKSCAEAIREFETALGGGNRDAGRKLLTERSGALKPTPVRMAAAVRFYAAVRLYVLRWAAAGQDGEARHQAHGAAAEEPPAPRGERPLEKLLAMAEAIPLPNATPEQREAVRQKIEEFREKGQALGLLDSDKLSDSDTKGPRCGYCGGYPGKEYKGACPLCPPGVGPGELRVAAPPTDPEAN